MGFRCAWRVACEACDVSGPSFATQAEAEARALKGGWLRAQALGAPLHLCPACAGKGLPDWWPGSTGTRFHWEEADDWSLPDRR